MFAKERGIGLGVAAQRMAALLGQSIALPVAVTTVAPVSGSTTLTGASDSIEVTTRGLKLNMMGGNAQSNPHMPRLSM